MADFRPANVPYSPLTDANERLPETSDYFHVNVSPDAFGAQIGEAMQGAGRQLQATGSQTMDLAARQQALSNETTVNNALTSYQQNNDAALYQPPKLDNNGNPIAGTGGYFAQRGAGAVNSYQAATAAVNGNYEQTRAALNPRQQVMFDQLARREHDYTLRNMGSHADSQGNVWQDQQTQAYLDTTSQSASLAAVNGNTDVFDQKIQNGEAAALHWADLKGYGSEWGQNQAQLFVGKTVMNSAKQMLDAGQIHEAAALLGSYEGKMDKGSVLAVKGALQGDRRAIEAQQAADQYLGQLNGNPSSQGQGQGQTDNTGIQQQDNRIEGKISLDGQTFDFASGGRNRGNVPLGTYKIGDFTTGDQRAQGGFSYQKDAFPILGSLPDARYPNAPRVGILIHQGSSADVSKVVTSGCLGISRDEWPQFEQALINTQKKYGNLVLEVSKTGVSIRPANGAPESATTSIDHFIQKAPEVRPPAGPDDLGTQGPVSTDTMVSALSGQESNGNPNAPTSTDGAQGEMQITPATWHDFAQPGEDINNPADNRAVGQRIVQHYMQTYDGDPARVAVAYFSGASNVAPAGSPTPWKADTSDSNGKSVSSYVSDVMQRVGQNPHAQKADIYANKASIIQDVRQKYADDPQMADAVISRVNAGMTISMLNQRAQQEAGIAQQDQALDEYLRPAMKGEPVDQLIPKLADDPRIDGKTREHIYNALQTMGQGKAYGSNFYDYFQKIHSTGTDKITNPADLLPLVDGQKLTLEGFDKLKSEMQAGKNIDGMATGDMIKSSMAYMKHQLSFSADYGSYKIPDPKGEDILNTQAIPAFYKAYQSGIAAGKTPYQLLSKDSPDFIADKLVSSFKRPDSELMKDKLEAGANDLPSPEKTGPSPYNFDITKANLSDSSGIEAARQAVWTQYLGSPKTKQDYDHAQADLNKLKDALSNGSVPTGN